MVSRGGEGGRLWEEAYTQRWSGGSQKGPGLCPGGPEDAWNVWVAYLDVHSENSRASGLGGGCGRIFSYSSILGSTVA